MNTMAHSPVNDADPAEYALADYAVALTYEDLPQGTRDHLRNVIVDAMGIAIGAFRKDHASGMIPEDLALSSFGANKGVALWSGRGRVPSEIAAQCNATWAEVLDFQDVVVDPRNNGHLAVTLVPAVLAIAARESASGAQVITALAAGLEVAISVLRAVGREHRNAGRGFRTTSIAAPIGAAIACGKLLGLDRTQMLDAMGLAGACSPNGLMPSLSAENGRFGMDKDWVNGLAAQLGVNSADLASRGMTGSDRVVTGDKGMIASHAHGDAAPLVAPAAGAPNVGSVALKKFAACYGVHSAMEATIVLMTQKGLTPQDIDKIVINAKADSTKTLAGRDISNHLAARFSLPYSVASAAVRGTSSTLQDFEEPSIFDPDVLSFMERVELIADPVLTAWHDETGGFPSRIEVHAGGFVHELRIDYPVGSLQRPMGWEEIAAKFTDLTEGQWSDEARSAVLAKAEGFADLSDVNDLLDLM